MFGNFKLDLMEPNLIPNSHTCSPNLAKHHCRHTEERNHMRANSVTNILQNPVIWRTVNTRTLERNNFCTKVCDKQVHILLLSWRHINKYTQKRKFYNKIHPQIKHTLVHTQKQQEKGVKKSSLKNIILFFFTLAVSLFHV